MDQPVITSLEFRYKYFLAILGVFISGLALLIASHYIPVPTGTVGSTIWRLLCEQLAAAFLVGAFTGGLYEYFIRREFLRSTLAHANGLSADISSLGEQAEKRAERIADFFAANKEQRELGISHCFKEVDRFDFTEYLENTQEMVAVLNDGRGWVGNYYQRFVNRFDGADKRTTLILMHPNSPAISLQAAKVGTTPEGMRMKIAETVRLIHRANEKRSPVRILGHSQFNTLSVFLGDGCAMVTPYFVSKVRRTPPLLCFSDTGRESFYHRLRQDIEALLVECRDISSYVIEDGSPMEEPDSSAARSFDMAPVGLIATPPLVERAPGFHDVN